MSNKKLGVILGYLAMAVTNLSSFFLTPLMLLVFGTSEFGIYKLVLSITSYFALADLGLSNAVLRYISEYRSNKDKESESKFVGLVTFVDLIIGVVVILLGILFYYFIPQIFQNSFNRNEIILLKKLFFLIVITGVFTLFINFGTALLKAYEKFPILNAINIAKTFVRTGLILTLLLSNFKSFEIVLVDTVLMAIVFIYTVYYCLNVLNISISFKNLEVNYSKKIFSYSIIIFIDAVAFHFLMAADSFIIGIYISSRAIAIYSIGTLLSALFFSFSIVVSDVLMPNVISQVTQGASDTELTDYAIRIGRIKSILLGLPIIGFIFFGQQFIYLWVGKDFLIAYHVALLILIPQMISALMDVPLYIMWAKNKHQIKSFVSLGVSVLNIFLTIILVKEYGIIGAAISTCFAYVSVYLVFNGIFYHKVLHLDMIRFVKQVSSKLWIGMAIVCVGTYVVSLYDAVNWFVLIFQFIIVTLIYIVAIWFFGMNNSEKQLILIPLAKLKEKFKK